MAWVDTIVWAVSDQHGGGSLRVDGVDVGAHHGPVRLPPLPGRLNRPTIRRLVWLAGLPLALLCGLGLVLPDPPPAPTNPVATTSVAAPATPTIIRTTPPAPPVRTTPPPKPKPPTRTTTKPPTTDHRYATCAQAKAHGLGPYYRGVDPEYAWYRDADHDGIVCE